MFDIREVRKAVLGNDRATRREGKPKERWRLVPIGYLVECFEERAAVLQFEAGLKRNDAERESEVLNAKRFRVYELVIEK